MNNRTLLPRTERNRGLSLFSHWVLMVAVMGFIGEAEAATCTSRQDGNWSGASQWNCGSGSSNGPPASSDDVVINHNISLNTTTTVLSVTVNGSLIQTGNSTRALTVTGNFTNYGTVNDNGNNGRFDLTVGGALVSTDSFDADNLTVSGSTTISNNFSVDQTFTANGDLTNNSGTFVAATLVFGKSGTQAATFYGSASTVGDLTVNGGSTVSSANFSALNVTGDFSNGGSLSLPNTTFIFNGSSAQSITGNSPTLGSLTLNNGSGLTLSTSVVSSGLTFTSGRITTGGNILTVGGNCPGAVSGASSTRYVIGNLRLTYPNWNVTCTYPVGTSSTYAPITVAIPWFAGIAGGTLTGSTTNGEHPQIASSGIDSTKDVNRYWTLGVAGDTMSTLPAGGSYTLSLGFVAGDVDAGATVTSFKVGQYGGSSWSTLAGSASGTTATYTGGTSFGSYATGQLAPLPAVTSINRASFNPTTTNTAVSWTVVFSTSVTGVGTDDFTLAQAGGAAGATITSVTGSGTTWTVTANTGTGTTGTLGLNLIDNDTIVSGTTPLGGVGPNNGNFGGQTYTILAPACTGASDIIYCDDFERSNPASVGNGWTFVETTPSNCTGVNGNRRCAGIDSDIPPFNVYTNPRANSTRSMFTRWDVVTVTSPTVDLSAKTGAQLSFWMRRGGDAFSEYPELAGENYLVEYLASDNTWKVLAQYPSGVMQGQVFTPVIELPADALHSGFKMRFYQPSGSGDAGGDTGGGAPGVVGYDYWHMDNVIIREKAAPSYVGSFCDNFEAGLGRWSISAEGATVGSPIGDASIGTLAYQSAGHELDLRWGYVAASTFKTNLSAINGNISYWVRSGTNTTRDPDAGENLVVDYLNSGGTWTTLATYLGDDLAGTSYTANIAIPADAKHANFRLRFRQLGGSGYDRDYWHIDDVCVGDPPANADLALSKAAGVALTAGSNGTYILTATNNGPGTLAGSIQIEDTLPSTLSYVSYAGTGWTCSANAQLVTCGWSGTLTSGTSAPALTLTVALDAAATGTITNTATVSGTVIDSNSANNTASHSTLLKSSFAFTDKACNAGVEIGQGANPCNLITWSPQTAGVPTPMAVFVTALNSGGTPTALSGSDTNLALQLGLVCVNPTTNAGVQAVLSVYGTLPLCAAAGNAANWSSATNVTFTGGSPSASVGTFSYADVGMLNLYVRDSANTTREGSSGNFVVKPHGFTLSNIVRTSDSFANPGATGATGDKFVAAGEPFTVTVTATASGGTATPNYGKEIAPEESVKLTSVLVAPLDCDGVPANDPDCHNPAIVGSFGAFTSGSATGTAFVWDEVGIIKLTPSIKDGDYLGAGDVTGTASGNVGRFYAGLFNTVVTQVSGVPLDCMVGLTCPLAYPGMVYSGQTFQVDVTARSLSTGYPILQNYDKDSGGFAKAVTLDAKDGVGSSSAVSVGSVGGSPVAASTFNAGAAANTSTKYTFTAPVSPANWPGPTNIYLRATDADGGTSLRATDPTTTSVEGGVMVVRGRLRLSNAFGSDKLPLIVPTEIQFWNGSYWATSSTDSATKLTSAPTLTKLLNNDGSVNSATVTLVNAAPYDLSGGKLPCATASDTECLKITTDKPVALDVSFDLGAMPWLQYPGTTNPKARVTFGIYKENQKIIHRRELR